MRHRRVRDGVAERDAVAHAEPVGERLELRPVRPVRVGEHRSVQCQRRVGEIRQRAQGDLPALHGRVAAEAEQPAQRRAPLGHARQRSDVDPVPDRPDLRGAQRHGAQVDRQQLVDDALGRLESGARGLLREPQQQRDAQRPCERSGEHREDR